MEWLVIGSMLIIGASTFFISYIVENYIFYWCLKRTSLDSFFPTFSLAKFSLNVLLNDEALFYNSILILFLSISKGGSHLLYQKDDYLSLEISIVYSFLVTPKPGLLGQFLSLWRIKNKNNIIFLTQYNYIWYNYNIL